MACSDRNKGNKLTSLSFETAKMQTTKTMTRQLQERQNASLILPTSVELLNAMSLQTTGNTSENSKQLCLWRSECNSEQSEARMSGRIFVLSYTKKPLAPCKPSKARKLICGGVAKVVWNKFGQFGIQLLVRTREETPKTILGCDWGTKFEGYSVVSETDNNLNVMWLLPNKKTIVSKLEERRRLRRARRWRNSGRREYRFDNRKKNYFIAPSQLMIVNSRLKAMNELLKCYPIRKAVIEDVKFNHRDKKWGKNFSTIEVGKQKIYNQVKEQLGKRGLKLVKGYDTFNLLKKYGLKKNRSDKSKEDFYTHCIDSFIIASEQFKKEQKGFMQRIGNKINEQLIIVDDTYRPTRRRLHDTQPKKGGIRDKYSTGSFKGIRKGTVCEFGQIVGGWNKSNSIAYKDFSDTPQKGKTLKKVYWLSHKFKTKLVGGKIHHYPNSNSLG